MRKGGGGLLFCGERVFYPGMGGRGCYAELGNLLRTLLRAQLGKRGGRGLLFCVEEAFCLGLQRGLYLGFYLCFDLGPYLDHNWGGRKGVYYSVGGGGSTQDSNVVGTE